MLISFSVSNFRSIKEEVTLNMESTNISEFRDTLIKTKDGGEYLPLGALYGPNGGGKSNLLSALLALAHKVMRPVLLVKDNEIIHMSKSPTKAIPFKFDDVYKNDLPTTFEIMFIENGKEYKYNLEIKGDVVLKESLYVYDYEDDPILLFSLEDNGNHADVETTIFDVGEMNEISNTLPLLSYGLITKASNEYFKDIFTWFTEKLSIFPPDVHDGFIDFEFMKQEETKHIMLFMFKCMDINIVDYTIEEEEGKKPQIIFTHQINDNFVDLNYFEESAGTIKLFKMLPRLIYTLSAGGVIVVDELDQALHPKLLGYVIDLFRKKDSNYNNAQLIFTSHDLMTMSNDYFRRDEIWFIAKNGEEASQLYSLIEFKKENGKKPRNDEKYGKQYIEGRYGADPYLTKMSCWGDNHLGTNAMGIKDGK